MEKVFIGLSKRKAIKKAMGFWYENFQDQISLTEFFTFCSWKKVSDDFYIIYRGPKPKEK